MVIIAQLKPLLRPFEVSGITYVSSSVAYERSIPTSHFGGNFKACNSKLRLHSSGTPEIEPVSVKSVFCDHNCLCTITLCHGFSHEIYTNVKTWWQQTIPSRSQQTLPAPGSLERTSTSISGFTGVVAGKFLGVRRIFAWISPNLHEMFLCDVAYKFSPTKIMKTLFWYDLQKRSSLYFSANVGRHFWNQTTLGPIFARVIRDFARIFDKTKLLGVRLHPHPLQHWVISTYFAEFFAHSQQVWRMPKVPCW